MDNSANDGCQPSYFSSSCDRYRGETSADGAAMSSFSVPRPPTLRIGTGTLTYGLSVREILGLSTLADARLIAGAGGLGRVVQRLNVMEVPDVLAWVKPNELLLT